MLNVENRIQYMITFNSNVMIRNLFLLVVFLGCVSLRHVEAAIDIVPKPVKLVETDGRFDITSACSIVVNDDLKTCGELLADYLQPAMGYRLAPNYSNFTRLLSFEMCRTNHQQDDTHSKQFALNDKNCSRYRESRI